MDSLFVVTFLSQYVGHFWANLIFTSAIPLIIAGWRSLIHWANNRPTTWYWNPITKKFFIKWGDKQIARICGRGVNDCNFRYEENLPDEAKEELKKHLIKKYPLLQIKVPGEK
jgi:hypothetical protein